MAKLAKLAIMRGKCVTDPGLDRVVPVRGDVLYRIFSSEYILTDLLIYGFT